MPPCADDHYVTTIYHYLSIAPFIPLLSLVWTSIGIWTVLTVQLFLHFPRFSFNHNKCDMTSPSDDGHVFLFYLLHVWIPPWISCTLIFAFPFRETFLFLSSSLPLCLKFEAFITPNKLILVRFLHFKFPLMVDFVFLMQHTPFVSFFFARLGVFLEYSVGKHPQVGLFLPRCCATFRHVLVTLYPLIWRSIIQYHLEMAVVEERDFEVRSSDLKTGLSSNNGAEEKDVDTDVSKLLQPSNPSLSSSSTPFHTLFESCCLKTKQLKSIRKRFQFLCGTVAPLPHPNEKAYAFAHGEVCFYEAAFSYGLCFPIHPFIMSLLSSFNIAPGKLVPNAWRTIISCMPIWVSVHERDMISLNKFLHLYRLKPSTHYGYYELFPWSRKCRIVSRLLSSFRDWKSWYFFVFGSGWETMFDDLWGEVPWLLRKWEIPSHRAFF